MLMMVVVVVVVVVVVLVIAFGGDGSLVTTTTFGSLLLTGLGSGILPGHTLSCVYLKDLAVMFFLHFRTFN
jgi:hypothetical protein